MIDNYVKIREIFKSIQGEGPCVGILQIFIRFCGCNLKCSYCDTDFELSKSTTYSPVSLMEEIENLDLPYPADISLTGGEPLLSVDFLKDFLPLAKKKGHRIYLETNATLPDKLSEIIHFVDVISADIKLPSATGMQIKPDSLESFFAISSQKNLFAKIVFDKNITDAEIDFSVKLAKKYNFELILQPMMIQDRMSVSTAFCVELFEKFYSKYPKVRLIPQVHKFLNVR